MKKVCKLPTDLNIFRNFHDGKFKKKKFQQNFYIMICNFCDFVDISDSRLAAHFVASFYCTRLFVFATLLKCP